MGKLTADVLVLGAGPAGSSAAACAARAGLKTILVDRHEFPRDKVCGDALIPDALRAVSELGLDHSLTEVARIVNGIRLYAPDGTEVRLTGRAACLPRRELDEMLRANAVRRGARFLAPLNIEAPMGRDRIEGAVLRSRTTREVIEIQAGVTILATGAGIDGLNRFSMALRKAPAAVALRAYYRVPPHLSAEFDHLCISYDQSTSPGYGWIFPGPQSVFNVGVGYFTDGPGTGARREPLALWRAFTTRFQPAADLIRASRQVAPLRGAPLRTAMSGARLWRPGLLVAGEAAGLKYSFSGAGIGKAMASDMIAADLAHRYVAGELALEDLGPAYARRLAVFAPRFRAYAVAQRWLASPVFANFLARRARQGTFVRRQLEGLFDETADPTTLFSVTGVLRSLVS